MDYDVFISYDSLDRPWAKKLEADLEKRGVRCFFDQSRLVKGKKWEPQLLGDLVNSRHFVVLWSDNARQSDWVQSELQSFKSSIDPKGEGQPKPGHLLYAINLQGQNATLAAYQGYDDKGFQEAYDQFVKTQADPGKLDARVQQAWDIMVAEIAAAAKADNPAIPVPVAVLALTTEILKEEPPRKPQFDFVHEQGVDDFLSSLGVEKMSDLSGRYGASPFLWHPFGSPETVEDLLANLLADPQTGINGKLAELKQPPVRWVPLDVVTPPINQLKQVAQPLVSGPCLVIVDPVSLFSYPIWHRYVKLAPCFSNPQAAIIFLTPFGSNKPLLFLRQCLTEQGRPNLDWFHDPIPFNPGYANCGINIADKWDIRRLVLASLGRQPSSRAPSGGESFLGT